MKGALVVFVGVLLLGLAACEEDDPGTSQERFHGTYMVRDLTLVIQARQIDSVRLTVTNNRFYSLFFYDAEGLDVDFCDCEGGISDFGTNRVFFNPTNINYIEGHCDTLRIPRGEFAADFVTHGDTVYFEQRSGDSLFQFLLRQ